MSIEQPYPRQSQEGVPDPSHRTRVLKMTAIAAGVAVGMVAMVGLFFGLLWAVNPMGDEWICSDGESPAGSNGTYHQCFEDGSKLPPGMEWDPWGNRPLASNCDKDGWMLIQRIPRGGKPADAEEDCVREGTDLPGGWHAVEED